MKINAKFLRKEPKIETNPCFVEVIEPMTDSEFNRFGRNLLKDYDFIELNIDNMYHDGDGTCHCVLALNMETGDGVLIDSSGSKYARYSSFVPHIKPYIDQQIALVIDRIMSQALTNNRLSFDLEDLSEQCGVRIGEINGISEMFVAQLDQKMEIYDYEFEDGFLYITPNIGFCKELQEQLVTACNSNHWLSNTEEYPLEDYPFSFKQISSASDLKDYFEGGNMGIRCGVLYEDLAFVQQVNGGDEWLTFKKEDGIYKDFESVSFELILKNDGDDGFYEYLDSLLSNTIDQYFNSIATAEQHQPTITM